jgi:hypothetical protein
MFMKPLQIVRVTPAGARAAAAVAGPLARAEGLPLHAAAAERVLGRAAVGPTAVGPPAVEPIAVEPSALEPTGLKRPS